jgi:hypothetical protein
MWISLIAELFACSTSLKQLEKFDSWIRRASGLRIAVTAQKIVSKKVLSKNLVRPTIGWLQRIPVGM